MFDEPEQSDLPWVLTIDEDSWVDFHVEVSTVEQEHDAGPPKGKKDNSGWSCYRLTISVEGEEFKSEIPFHAMADFYKACDEGKEKKGWIELEVRRKRDGDKTTLEFR